MKLYICSGKRSGKDYAAEYLKCKLGIKYESSSMFAIKNVLFNRLQKEFGFKTPEEAYENRQSPEMRKWLFEAISDINKNDLTDLSALIFKENNCYVGIRNYEELEAAKKRWEDVMVIWIDAEGRVPEESVESCTVKKSQADVIIENKGTVEEFDDKLRRLCAFILANKNL